jgi:hypothetical protein
MEAADKERKLVGKGAEMSQGPHFPTGFPHFRVCSSGLGMKYFVSPCKKMDGIKEEECCLLDRIR